MLWRNYLKIVVNLTKKIVNKINLVNWPFTCALLRFADWVDIKFCNWYREKKTILCLDIVKRISLNLQALNCNLFKTREIIHREGSSLDTLIAMRNLFVFANTQIWTANIVEHENKFNLFKFSNWVVDMFFWTSN